MIIFLLIQVDILCFYPGHYSEGWRPLDLVKWYYGVDLASDIYPSAVDFFFRSENGFESLSVRYLR